MLNRLNVISFTDDVVQDKEPEWNNPITVIAVDEQGNGVIVQVLNEMACPHTLEMIQETGVDIGDGFSAGIYQVEWRIHSYCYWTDCGNEYDSELIADKVLQLNSNVSDMKWNLIVDPNGYKEYNWSQEIE